MPNLIENFEQLALREFNFLKRDYHFEVHSIKKDNYGCFMMLKTASLAIRISLEIYDGGVFAKFYKIKDGEIPEYPVFFDPTAEFLIFDFNDLMRLRCGKVISQDSKRIYEPAYLESLVHEYAIAIKENASDVLTGDLSVFELVKGIVVRRAKELEHER
jgi:hypothetical protein